MQRHTVRGGAVVEVAGLAVDGVGVGGRRGIAGEERRLLQFVDVVVPPLAEHDDHLLVGLGGERVGAGAAPGQDDERAVDGGAEEGDVGVPPQRAFLARDVEAVGVVGGGPDGALRHHHRPVGPLRAPLEYAVPALRVCEPCELMYEGSFVSL